jgi:hypothetical protein
MKPSLSFPRVRRTVVQFLVLTIFVVPVEAQMLSFGCKAGATLSDPILLNNSTSSLMGYVSFPFGFNSFQASTTANSWEFPLLVKRTFRALRFTSNRTNGPQGCGPFQPQGFGSQ